MIELLKVTVVCFTVAAVVLPVAFLAALSLPHNSELRRMVMKVCYWGVALLAIGYFAMPSMSFPTCFFHSDLPMICSLSASASPGTARRCSRGVGRQAATDATHPPETPF